MIYFCTQKNRRDLVLQTAALNGIDYLEVLGEPGCGHSSPSPSSRMRGRSRWPPPTSASPAAAPSGRHRSQPTAGDPSSSPSTSTGPAISPPTPSRLLRTPGGQRSARRLRPPAVQCRLFVQGRLPDARRLPPEHLCPPELRPPPDINYLAKDYDGFRQVMLDRLAVLTPGLDRDPCRRLRHRDHRGARLRRRSPELPAGRGQHRGLSGTARSRISLRRHARLVDYTIGEGCNARALGPPHQHGADNCRTRGDPVLRARRPA